MKTIDTLIPDIYELLRNGNVSLDQRTLSESISRGIVSQLGEDAQTKRTTLRLSGMGPRCPKALWASIHRPDAAEPLEPWARVKFTFGTIIEHLAISLCKAAGHEVTGEQDELHVDGITGHRDAVVDGCLVDFKSCSSRMFQKYKDKSISKDDPFGALDQMDGYLVGSLDDPLVRVKDRGYIFAVDKTLGHMVLYEHTLREREIRARISSYKDIVSSPQPPRCTCGTLPDGKSGNIRLDIKASYSVFKHCCFPNLRTFLYASGPVYLTHVERVPDVPELKRDRHQLPDFDTDGFGREGGEVPSGLHRLAQGLATGYASNVGYVGLA